MKDVITWSKGEDEVFKEWGELMDKATQEVVDEWCFMVLEDLDKAKDVNSGSVIPPRGIDELS